MTSERQAYVYVQLPDTLNIVPAALLKVEKLRDGNFVGRFRYGDRYLKRRDAVEFDPFQLPLGNNVYELTKLKGIPGAVRDAAPDAWGRCVIEHKLQRGPADLEEIDYLLHGPQDGAGYLSFGTKVEPQASKRRYNRTHQLVELVAAADDAAERAGACARRDEVPAQPAQVLHRPAIPEKRTAPRGRRLAPAADLALRVERGAEAVGAAERAEVVHRAIPEKCMHAGGGGAGAHDLASSVHARSAAGAAVRKRAQILNGEGPGAAKGGRFWL